MTSDPATLFRAVIEALNDEDWETIAALCDPSSLTIFYRQLLRRYGQEQPKITVEDYLRNAPEMPREVAAWEVEKLNKSRSAGQRLRQEIPGVGDMTELRGLGPTATFASWLRARSPRGQVEQAQAAGHISDEAAERALSATRGAFPCVLLGVVSDGSQVAHIIFREEFDPAEPLEPPLGFSGMASDDEWELVRDISGRLAPEVASCRRQPDGTWRMVVGHDFLRFGSVIYGAS
jgi:hypothetical protein